MPSTPPKRRGRPPRHPPMLTAELADRIVAGILEGRTLRRASLDAGMKPTTVYLWVKKDHGGFGAWVRAAEAVRGVYPRGGLWIYSVDLAHRVWEALTQGASLREIGAMPGMPSVSTLMRWAREKPAFRALYSQGRWLYLTMVADQLSEIRREVTKATAGGAMAQTRAMVAHADRLAPTTHRDFQAWFGLKDRLADGG